MAKIVVIGGGISGIAAAWGCKKMGPENEVVIVERTDQLMGIGKMAGSMDVGARYMCHTEILAMGEHELNDVLDSIALDNMDKYRLSHFPWHAHPSAWPMVEHSWIYDVLRVDPAMRKFLKEKGIEVLYRHRVVDIEKDGDKIVRLKVEVDRHETKYIDGDIFIDACGNAGGQNFCVPYVGGCVMCPFMQCTTFGNRVDISGKAGGTTISMHQEDGTPGVLYNGIYIYKESLSPELRAQLRETHQIFIQFRNVIDWENDARYDHASGGQEGSDENGMVTDPTTSWRMSSDSGHFRLLDRGIYAGGAGPSPMKLEQLRQIPGMENAVIACPVGGMNLFSLMHEMVVVDLTMKVPQVDNLFACGSKADILGIQEGIANGMLVGYNVNAMLEGRDLITIPRTTVIGDLFAASQDHLLTPGGPIRLLGGHAGDYLVRCKEMGWFPDTEEKAAKRVAEAGLTNIFAAK